MPYYFGVPREQWGFGALLKSLTSVVVLEGGRESWYSLQNQNSLIIETCLGFWGLKKGSDFVIIVGWFCPHTAKTHLYANEDILCPMSSLKLKYYNLNSSYEGF